MLEAGGLPVITDGLRAADEDNVDGYYEFEPVKQVARDASWLTAAGGRAVKMVYRLLYDLPPDFHYRVIFLQRRMAEVLASQRKMLERRGVTGSLPSDEQMASLFASQLHKVRSWLGQQANFRVLQVSYNELLRDPGPAIAEINRFLGGGLDVAAMAGVINPARYRNRQEH
jgi:hypothetical protein